MANDRQEQLQEEIKRIMDRLSKCTETDDYVDTDKIICIPDKDGNTIKTINWI